MKKGEGWKKKEKKWKEIEKIVLKAIENRSIARNLRNSNLVQKVEICNPWQGATVFVQIN